MFELYSHRPGYLHRLDARVKVVFTLAFVLFLSLTPANAWPAYVLFLAFSLSLAAASRLGIGYVLKRSFLAIPFVMAAAPLVFTGPGPYSSIPILQGRVLPYSPQGLARFISITLRSWISVQAAILLASTTRFPDLLAALKQLKVPGLFIAVIGLMWRYLFVIGGEAGRMLRARASRSATLEGGRRPGGSVAWRAKVTGGMAGSLFLRSLERSERVYAAMLSRGYDGSLPVADSSGLARVDALVLFSGILLVVLLWFLGLLGGG